MSTDSYISLSIGTAFLVSGFIIYKKRRADSHNIGTGDHSHRHPGKEKRIQLPLGLLSVIFFIIGLYSLAGPLLTPHIGTDFWVLLTFIFIASFLALIRYVIK